MTSGHFSSLYSFSLFPFEPILVFIFYSPSFFFLKVKLIDVKKEYWIGNVASRPGV